MLVCLVQVSEGLLAQLDTMTAWCLAAMQPWCGMQSDAGDLWLDQGEVVLFRVVDVVFRQPPTIAELKAAQSADAGGLPYALLNCLILGLLRRKHDDVEICSTIAINRTMLEKLLSLLLQVLLAKTAEIGLIGMSGFVNLLFGICKLTSASWFTCMWQ